MHNGSSGVRALPPVQSELTGADWVRLGREEDGHDGRRSMHPAVVDAVCLLGREIRVLAVLEGAGGAFAPAHSTRRRCRPLAGWLGPASWPMAEHSQFGISVDFPVDTAPAAVAVPLAWSSRERIALKDALYVALALTLDASLLTTDKRLARAVEGIVPLA